jgi:hypothetical protein
MLGDPVLDELAIARHEALPLLGEDLGQAIERGGDLLGARLGDGKAPQKAHPAFQTHPLGVALQALKHPHRLRVADPFRAQGHQILGRDLRAQGQILRGELLASGPDPDIQVDRHQAVENRRRVHGTSQEIPEDACRPQGRTRTAPV